MMVKIPVVTTTSSSPKRLAACSLACLLLIGLLLPVGSARAQDTFERGTELAVAGLLGAESLKSNLYTVDPTVANDGLMNHYTVRSKFGVFRAGSSLAVNQLLHEIKAIAAMKKVETKDTATASVVQSGKNTVDAVANLVTEPKETLEGAAAGVGSLFNRASQVVGKRETTNAEDNKMSQFIGKTKSKGKIATTYGVSIYSSNPVLQEELDRLAWADYLGGIGVGLAQSAIPGVGGLLLSTSGTARLLNDVINTTPASELWVRNKNKLAEMRVNADTVQLFLNNPYFSPALQTVMVEAMGRMKGVANRELLITVSLQANSAEVARTITEVASMLAGYHEKVAPLAAIAPLGRIVQARAKNGAVVVLFPADHVMWTARVADIASWLVESTPAQPKKPQFQLWVLGDFSKRAQSELQALGWQLYPAAQAKLFL